MTSIFPSNTLPILAPGGRATGGALVPRASQNVPTQNLTSLVYVNGLGDDRLKLAPLIRASNRKWGDIDLFTVHAGNAMMLSDVLVFKLAATTGVSGLTGVLAPKVQVPNNINTFKGRQYTYNVIPATVVPKRGTVRTMTKTVREWQANMKQSGIGSHIEGGAYRSPEGRVFLEQELTAFGLSIEMNICLSTAQTAFQSAIAKPFFNVGKAGISAVSYSKQMARELKTFCCGVGDSGLLSSCISDTLLTIPNASLMFMPIALAQNLAFNDKQGPREYENQSVSMIEEGGKQTSALLKNGATSSLYTVFNGRIGVMEMPTFTFQEGMDIYQPLQHAMVVGDYFTLNAERGLKAWYELDPTNSADKASQQFRIENLSHLVYDQSRDSRAEVTFSNAMQYTHMFSLGAKHNMYHFEARSRREAYSNRLVTYVAEFNAAYASKRTTSVESSVINWTALSKCWGTYVAAKDTLLEEFPYIDVQNTRGTNRNPHVHDVINTLQSFKRYVQFPLTSRFSAENGVLDNTNPTPPSSDTLEKFCLPNCIGDLDPAHLPSNFFKVLVEDVKGHLQQSHILDCPEYQSYLSLRARMTETPFDPLYWECLWSVNQHRLLAESNTKNSLAQQGTAVDEIDQFLQSISTGAWSEKFVPTASWPRLATTDLMILPDDDAFRKFLQARGIEKGTGIAESRREFLPQGLWSAQGLKYLANSAMFGQGSYSKWANECLVFLTCLWDKLTKVMPYTIFTSCGDAHRMVYFSNLGARFNVGGKTGAASLTENDTLQILMNLLDSDLELYQVSMDTSLLAKTPESFAAAFGKDDTHPASCAYLIDPSYVNLNTNTDGTSVVLKSSIATYTIPVDAQLTGHVWRILDGFISTHASAVNPAKYLQDMQENIRTSTAAKRSDILNNAKNPAQGVLSWPRVYALIANLMLACRFIQKDVLGDRPTDVGTISIFSLVPTDNTKVQVDFTLPLVNDARPFYEPLLVSINDAITTARTAPEIIAVTTTREVVDNQKDVKGSTTLQRSTGFVIAYKQLPLDANGNIDFTKINKNIKFYSNFGLPASYIDNQAVAGNETHTTVYRRLLNKFHKYGRIQAIFKNFQIGTFPDDYKNVVCHTHWFEKRMEIFGDPSVKGAGNDPQDWKTIDRLVANFILHSQFGYSQTLKGIQTAGMRPVFEISCFRLWQKFIMNALLLAYPGMSTMFNPYTNAHIGMSRDGITDQYAIRAVVETDTVVINPNNLAAILGVSPTSYCGGRNVKFIYDAATARSSDEADLGAPSIIAVAGSYGFMVTTEEPISFINNPPAATINGVVSDVSSNQFWPGADYYGRRIYGEMFSKAPLSWEVDLSNVKDSQSQMAFSRWLDEAQLSNHVAFRTNSKVFDPFANTFSQNINGTGHLGLPWMNEQGAKEVFDGRSTTPINTVRPPPTNYY